MPETAAGRRGKSRQATALEQEEKILQAVKLLQEKQETVGRTPKKEDFESVQVCFIKQILGPWPRALEKAGLKQPPVISSREKTQAKRARMKEKRKQQKRSNHL